MQAKHLAAYVAQLPRAPFSWTDNSCAHFVGRWLGLRTGTDPIAPLRPANERAARRVIRAHGGSLAALWSARLGRPAIPAAQAQVGDVVVLDVDGVPATGICNGATAVALSAAGTVVFLPMSAATHAWRLSC